MSNSIQGMIGKKLRFIAHYNVAAIESVELSIVEGQLAKTIVGPMRGFGIWAPAMAQTTPAVWSARKVDDKAKTTVVISVYDEASNALLGRIAKTGTARTDFILQEFVIHVQKRKEARVEFGT